MTFSLHVENGLIVALSNSHDFLKEKKKKKTVTNSPVLLRVS